MTKPEDEDLIPEDGPAVPAPQIQKKNRPMVEGINAPKIAPNVASQIITPVSTKITLPSMGKKSHFVRNSLVWLVVLAGLGYGGFRAYELYSNNAVEPTEQEANINNIAMTDDTLDVSGFSSSTPIGISSSTPSAIPAPASSTPAVEGAVLKQLKVNNTETGFLNVRSQPSTAGGLVAKIYPGETYPYTEVQFQWYHITLKDGSTGWVSGTYVTEQ